MNFARTLKYMVVDMTSSDRLFHKNQFWIPKGRDNRLKGYFVVSENDQGVADFFEFEELYFALKDGKAKISRDYHSAANSLLRALFGDKRLKEFKDEWVQLARQKEQIISFYEEHIRDEGKLTREELRDSLVSWNRLANEARAKSAKKEGKNSQKGSAIIVFDKAPNDRTFLDYYDFYLRCDRDIRSLVPRHSGPGKHHRLHVVEPESFATWSKFAYEYADSKRPSMKKLLNDCRGAISVENAARSAAGRTDLLQTPGRKQFENIIKSMDQYQVMAAREGITKAVAYFRGQMVGFDIERPGERVEFDSYLLELQTWLMIGDLWGKLDDKTRKDLKPIRVYLSMARDAATGYVQAVKWSLSENSTTVVDTLDMALSDKCHIARFVGAQTDWYGGVHIQSAYTDNGTAYLADDTRDAFREAGVSLSHPPAGQPWNRGFIESMLGVLARTILPYFDGRTFANVIQKGDYDPGARASLTVDEAVCLIIRAILDSYHHQINYRTKKSPHDAWLDYLEQTGAPWGPDREMRISVFGVSTKRVIHADGIYLWGIRYNSTELQKLRQEENPGEVEVRYHRDDLRQVAVRHPNGSWFLVKWRIRMKEQCTVEEWLMVRHKANNDASLAQLPMLDRIYAAFSDIKGSVEAARIRARLTPSGLSREELLTLESDTNRTQLGDDGFEDDAIDFVDPPARSLPHDPIRTGGVIMTRPDRTRTPIDSPQAPAIARVKKKTNEGRYK